jgi:hypothetical protein
MPGLEGRYIPILKGYLDEYIAKKRDERAVVINQAAQAIEELAEKDKVQPPLFVHKVSTRSPAIAIDFTIFIPESTNLVPKSPSSLGESRPNISVG